MHFIKDKNDRGSKYLMWKPWCQMCFRNLNFLIFLNKNNTMLTLDTM